MLLNGIFKSLESIEELKGQTFASCYIWEEIPLGNADKSQCFSERNQFHAQTHLFTDVT